MKKFFFLLIVCAFSLTFILYNQQAFATSVNATNNNCCTTNGFSINQLWAEKFTGLPVGARIDTVYVNTTAYAGAFDDTRVKIYKDDATSTLYPYNVTLGDTSSHTTGFNDLAVRLGKFTGLTPGQTITHVSLNVFANAGNVRVKIYDDTGVAGRAGALLGQSGSLAVTNTGIQDFAVSATIPADGIVWAGFEADSGTLSLYRNAGAGNEIVQNVAHVYGTGPDPFGLSAGDGVQTWVRVVSTHTNFLGGPYTLINETGNGALAQTAGVKTVGVVGAVNATVPASGNVWVAFENNDVSAAVNLIGATKPTGTSLLLAHTFGSGPSPYGLSWFANSTFNPFVRISYSFPHTAIYLNPSSGQVGKYVNMTGFSFSSANIADIYFNGIKQTQVVHIGTDWTKNIRVPVGARIGSNNFTARDEGSPNLKASAFFTVTAPNLFLNSTNGNVGKTISATGNSFVNNTSTYWRYDTNSLSVTPAIPTTNNTGGFSGVLFTIPKSVAGHHNVNVTDGWLNNGTAIYNVTSSVTLSPTSGIIGSTITVNGDGFKGNQPTTFQFDGVQIATGVTNVLGSFSNQHLTVPNAANGTHTIITSDGSHSVSSTFTVTGGFPSPVLDLHATEINLTNITLAWSQPNLNGLSLQGYQINYTTPHGQPVLIVINNTNSSSTTQTITGLTANTDYSFRIGIWAGTTKNMQGNIFDTTTTQGLVLSGAILGSTAYFNPLQISIGSPATANVTEVALYNSIGLLYDHIFTPPFPITSGKIYSIPYKFNDTNTGTQIYTAGAIVRSGIQNTTYISNSVTLYFGTFTPNSPNLNMTQTNTVTAPFKFVRTDINSTYVNLGIFYPSTFNSTCKLSFNIGLTNHTYYNLPTSHATFHFVGINNEVVTINCLDQNSNAVGTYVLTQSQNSFPLVQQIKDLRSGKMGTLGMFGAFDMVTLLALILSIIGFNRVNESVGAIFNVVLIGVLSFFGIIQWPVILSSSVALVLVLVISSTRKSQ